MSSVPGDASPDADVDVAVDAMGGDHAPHHPIKAAVRAARAGIRVALVGDRDTIERELAKRASAPPENLRVEHASEVIAMDEKPSRAVRTRPDASVCVAARAFRPLR